MLTKKIWGGWAVVFALAFGLSGCAPSGPQSLVEGDRLLREGKVRTVEDRDVDVRGETICVHGDTPRAVEFARELRTQLECEGVPFPLRALRHYPCAGEHRFRAVPLADRDLDFGCPANHLHIKTAFVAQDAVRRQINLLPHAGLFARQAHH